MLNNTTLTNTQIPCISVIIPIFNMEKYLAQALDSVLCQTLRNIEIICIDDGSTDSTPQILAEYAARDPRIRIITQENKGVGATRNVGIRAARGEFVAFLAPDDFLPDELTYEILYLWAKEAKVKVCGGSIRVFRTVESRKSTSERARDRGDLAFPKDGVRHFSEWQSDCGFCRYIFDREMLVRNGIFFPDYTHLQDLSFCTRALETSGTFYALRRPTYVWREREIFKEPVEPQELLDVLRVICDQMRFSRERGYAKLHWIQIARIFEELRSKICAVLDSLLILASEFDSVPEEGLVSSVEEEFLSLLHEVDELKDISLARKFMANAPRLSVREDIFEPEVKVSVVVPIYKVEKYLQQCVDSILLQTLREIEIILVDDGSPDSCPQIIDEYAACDPRVVPVHQPNGGYGKAVNTGIRLAKGKYIGVIESDDWIEPTMYEKLYAAAESCHSEVAKSEFFIYNSKNPPETQNIRWVARNQDLRTAPNGVFSPVEDYPLIFAYHASLWSNLYRADFVKKIPILESSSASYQDFPFIMEVLSKAKRMVVVKECLVHYRMEGGSGSSTMRSDARLIRMAEMCIYGRKVLEEAGTFQRVKEAFFFHSALANMGFYRNIDRCHLEEYFNRLKELFSPIKSDNEFSFKYFDAPERELVAEILDNDGPVILAEEKVDGGTGESCKDTAGNGTEVNSDGVLKRFVVRFVAMFILSKKKRKAFRAKHLNLAPRDGIDVRKTSPRELAILRERRRSTSRIWKLFDAFVPASRGKIAHIERHLREELAEQARRRQRESDAQLQKIITELRKSRDEANRRLDDLRHQFLREQSSRIEEVREKLTLRVLAASQKQAALLANAKSQTAGETGTAGVQPTVVPNKELRRKDCRD